MAKGLVMERLLTLLYLYLATPDGLNDSRAAGLLASEFGDTEANRQTVYRYRVTAFGGGMCIGGPHAGKACYLATEAGRRVLAERQE